MKSDRERAGLCSTLKYVFHCFTMDGESFVARCNTNTLHVHTNTLHVHTSCPCSSRCPPPPPGDMHLATRTGHSPHPSLRYADIWLQTELWTHSGRAFGRARIRPCTMGTTTDAAVLSGRGRPILRQGRRCRGR